MVFSNLGDDLFSPAVAAALAAPLTQVQQLTIESRYLPPLVIDQPLASTIGGPPGASSVLAAILKPKITLTLAGQSLSIAPFGEPGPNYWPLVLPLLLLGFGTAVYAGVKFLRR